MICIPSFARPVFGTRAHTASSPFPISFTLPTALRSNTGISLGASNSEDIAAECTDRGDSGKFSPRRPANVNSISSINCYNHRREAPFPPSRPQLSRPFTFLLNKSRYSTTRSTPNVILVRRSIELALGSGTRHRNASRRGSVAIMRSLERGEAKAGRVGARRAWKGGERKRAVQRSQKEATKAFSSHLTPVHVVPEVLKLTVPVSRVGSDVVVQLLHKMVGCLKLF